jgi:hypothetical protein
MSMAMVVDMAEMKSKQHTAQQAMGQFVCLCARRQSDRSGKDYADCQGFNQSVFHGKPPLVCFN